MERRHDEPSVGRENVIRQFGVVAFVVGVQLPPSAVEPISGVAFPVESRECLTDLFVRLLEVVTVIYRRGPTLELEQNAIFRGVRSDLLIS